MKLSLGRSLTKSMVAYFQAKYQFITFDGLAENVLTVESEDFNFSDGKPFSISAWYNLEGITTGVIGIFRVGGITASDNIIYAGVRKNNETSYGAEFRLQSGVSGYYLQISANLDIMVGWNHIIFAYDGSNNASGIEIYSNTVRSTKQIISDTLTELNNTQFPSQIGKYYTSNPSVGSIDDLIIFNKKLSIDESIDIYTHDFKTNIANLSLYSNIISYWGFVGNLNDEVGNNNLTSISPILKESNINAYLSENGNDVTAILNDNFSKYKTIDAALIDLKNIKSRYSSLFFEKGKYTKFTPINLISDIVFIGNNIPELNDNINPTKLINGTIIVGRGNFNEVKGIKLMNIGFDSGFDNGVEDDALSFSSNNYSWLSSGHILINVISLCYDKSSLYHSTRFERTKGILIQNLISVYGVHGIVFKCSNVKATNLISKGNNGDGLIIKKDNFNLAVENISVDGYVYENLDESNPQAGQIYIENGQTEPIDNVQILNADLVEKSVKLRINGNTTNIIVKDTEGNDITPI